MLHVDGSSNLKGAGAGTVLEGLNNILIEKSLHFAFKTSNNQAEYEAILVALSLIYEVGVKTLTCKIDSKLTMGHLNDEFQIWSARSFNPLLNKSALNTLLRPTTSEPTSYPN